MDASAHSEIDGLRNESKMGSYTQRRGVLLRRVPSSCRPGRVLSMLATDSHTLC